MCLTINDNSICFHCASKPPGLFSNNWSSFDDILTFKLSKVFPSTMLGQDKLGKLLASPLNSSSWRNDLTESKLSEKIFLSLLGWWFYRKYAFRKKHCLKHKNLDTLILRKWSWGEQMFLKRNKIFLFSSENISSSHWVTNSAFEKYH